MVPLIQEKLRTFSDAQRFVDFLFLEEPVYDEESWKKTMTDSALAEKVLEGAAAVFAECTWETEVLKNSLSAVGSSVDLKLGKAQAPVRVAVTGRTVGPPLFETMAECMERQEVLRRINLALARL